MTDKRTKTIKDIFYNLILIDFAAFTLGIVLSLFFLKINGTGFDFERCVIKLFGYENQSFNSLKSTIKSLSSPYFFEIKCCILIFILSFSEIAKPGIISINIFKSFVFGFVCRLIFCFAKQNTECDVSFVKAISIIFLSVLFLVLFSAYSSYFLEYAQSSKPKLYLKAVITSKQTYVLFFQTVLFSGIIFIIFVLKIIILKN